MNTVSPAANTPVAQTARENTGLQGATPAKPLEATNTPDKAVGAANPQQAQTDQVQILQQPNEATKNMSMKDAMDACFGENGATKANLEAFKNALQLKVDGTGFNVTGAAEDIAKITSDILAELPSNRKTALAMLAIIISTQQKNDSYDECMVWPSLAAARVLQKNNKIPQASNGQALINTAALDWLCKDIKGMPDDGWNGWTGIYKAVDGIKDIGTLGKWALGGGVALNTASDIGGISQGFGGKSVKDLLDEKANNTAASSGNVGSILKKWGGHGLAATAVIGGIATIVATGGLALPWIIAAGAGAAALTTGVVGQMAGEQSDGNLLEKITTLEFRNPMLAQLIEMVGEDTKFKEILSEVTSYNPNSGTSSPSEASPSGGNNNGVGNGGGTGTNAPPTNPFSTDGLNL
jgi:hypothetical protein